MTYTLVDLIRYLFAEAGERYEYESLPGVTLQSNFAEYSTKADVQYTEVPLLIYNGQTLSQGRAIARFLANQFGLVSKDEGEKALMDSVVDTCIDIMQPWGKPSVIDLLNENDKTEKEKKCDVFIESAIPFLKYFEALLNNEFVVGNEISWADFAIYDTFLKIENAGLKNLLKEFPNCFAHKKRISKRRDWSKLMTSLAMTSS